MTAPHRRCRGGLVEGGPLHSCDFDLPDKAPVRVVEDYDAERLVVIGDIHGCIDELATLTSDIKPTPRDIIVFCGDLVDRGPSSKAVVEVVKELCLTRTNTFCVLGNHEEKHIRYRRWEHVIKEGYQKKNPVTMRNPEVQAALSDAELAWMAGLPGVVKVRDFSSSFGPKEIWVTHAGFLPKDHLHQPFKGLVRNRFLRASAKGWSPATNQDGKNFYKQPEGSVVWDEAWTGPRVIYGNIVHDLEHIRVVNDCWGIDTGVVFGGMLTAYVHNLQTSAVDIHQVKARQVYFKESQED